MNQESILLNQSHYIGKISNIQDSILLCDEIHSNPFIGEIVYFNNNLSYKGLVFEMSLKNIKILLLDCDQKNLFIGDSILGSRETIKIKVGFHVLGNILNPVGNKQNSKFNSCQYSTLNDSSKSNLKETKYLIEEADVFFFNEKSNIDLLSSDEAKLLESKAIPLDSTLSGEVEDLISKKLSTRDKICIFFLSSQIISLLLYVFFILFYILFSCLHYILFYFLTLLIYICNLIEKPIFYLNTKYLGFSLTDSNSYDLLSIKNLSFFKQILCIFWLLFLDLPIILLLTFIFIFFNLIITLFCCIISIFCIPKPFIYKVNNFVSPYKYLFKVFLLFFVFIFFFFFYSLLNILFPTIKFIYIFMSIFIIISILNYKSKKNKVIFYFNISSFLLLITDIFRYRLRNLANSANQVTEDTGWILLDCNFLYNINSINFKIKKLIFKLFSFFKSKKSDNTEILDNNISFYSVDKNNLKVKSKNNSNQPNDSQKRFYMKKLSQISNVLGKNSEHFNKPSLFYKKLGSDFESNKTVIHNYINNKGIYIKSNSIDISTDSKINSLSKFKYDLLKNKLYTLAIHNDGSKCEYVSELTNNINNNNDIYFNKDNQIIKVNLDLSKLKINYYLIFKGIYIYEDFSVGTFDDSNFFTKLNNLFDKKMDKHPFFSFKYTSYNLCSGKIEARYGVITTTSSNNSSIRGDVFTKTYKSTNTITENNYNFKKPYSVVAEKLRDFNWNDFKNINTQKNYLDLTKANSKYSTVVKNYLLDKLHKDKNLIFIDPISGEKHILLFFGDFTQYLSSNPSLLSKILNDPFFMINIRFKLLSLYCESEDFIYSSYYNTNNTKDQFDYFDFSGQDLEIIN